MKGLAEETERRRDSLDREELLMREIKERDEKIGNIIIFRIFLSTTFFW